MQKERIHSDGLEQMSAVALLMSRRTSLNGNIVNAITLDRCVLIDCRLQTMQSMLLYTCMVPYSHHNFVSHWLRLDGVIRMQWLLARTVISTECVFNCPQTINHATRKLVGGIPATSCKLFTECCKQTEIIVDSR